MEGSRRFLRPTGDPRLPWLAGGFLVLLLALLAVLQLRWLGEVAEADRQRLDAGVRTALDSLTADVDREVSRAWLAFQKPYSEEPFTAEAAVQVWRRWREGAPVPELVGSLWVVDRPGAGPGAEERRARRFDGRAWVEEPAPFPLSVTERAFSLARPRQRSPGRGESRTPRDGGSFHPFPLLEPGLPGLVVLLEPSGPAPAVVPAPAVAPDPTPAPAPAPAVDRPGQGGPEVEGRDVSRRALVVLFDRAFLADELLPGLVGRYLEPVLGPGLDTRVAMSEGEGRAGAPDRSSSRRSSRGGVIVSLSEDGGTVEAGEGEEPPWRAPVFDLLPVDDLRRLAFATGYLPGEGVGEGGGEGGGEGSGASAGGDRLAHDETGHRVRRLTALASILGDSPGWVVEAWPAGGTLDATVARARWGNAGLAFGILLLLALATVALALSARRAQETARRQVEFTASISHELRTPLAGIRSLADNLADGLVRTPEQARLYGQQIARQGERLSEMVEQVLAVSAHEAGGVPRTLRTLGPVDLAGLVAEASAEARAAAPGSHVEVDVAADLPEVACDPTLLRRALQNLVTNALRHGGEPPWAAVRAGVEPGENELRIGVVDRGPGIPAAERMRIFEPFFRGQRAQADQLSGAGLGLHLVRRAAEAHGGRVELRSALGEGSTFTLVLPVSPALSGSQEEGA